MKHKVSELEGEMLNAAVAMAEGATRRSSGYWHWPDGGRMSMKPDPAWQPDDGGYEDWWSPSTLWHQAGPIIDRARMSIGPRFVAGEWRGEWEATCFSWFGEDVEHANCVGPEPLIAAMRAFVASRFGDTVELPA